MSHVNTGAYRVDPVRLEPLNRVPTLTEIQNALDIAQESRLSVQLPWACGEPVQYFTVSVVFSKDPFDTMPRWAFYKQCGEDFKVDWAYATPDVSLIHSMLLCTFSKEVLTPESHASYAYVPTMPGSDARLPTHAAVAQGELPRTAVLHGSLQKMPSGGLLQSLGASRMTGRVALSFHDLRAEIYLDGGAPVYCRLGELTGADAIVEALMWQAGEFEVFADEPAPEKDISRRLEALLMESAMLTDCERYLSQAGVSADSILSKNGFDRSCATVGQDSIPVDPALQMSIQSLIDDHHSMAEIAGRLHLSKAKWLPVLLNLIQSGAVRVRAAQAKMEHEDEIVVDTYPLKHLKEDLLLAGSGFYSAGMFLFLLEQEFFRYQVHRRPFSAIVIGLKRDTNQPLERPDLIQRLGRASNVLRASDTFCHFQGSSFGIIAPETNDSEAKAMVRNIVNQLTMTEESTSRGTLWMRIGSASVPFHCESLGILLTLAMKPEHSSTFMLK